jgi:hypothetical protein
MKTSHIAIVLSALIAVAMLGSLMLPRGEAALKANVAWNPKTYVLDTVGVPNLWNATLWGIDVTQIDYTTITAVGETAGTPVHAVAGEVSLAGRNDFIASFNGMDIRNLIWEIVLYHDLLSAPGRYRLTMVVSGTYFDTTPFQGSKTITVIIPTPPPPVPP